MSYFKLSEFACPCCKKAPMDKDFLSQMEKFREAFGHPLSVNSGYRCLKHNAEICGREKSQHLVGKAADIAIGGFSSEQKFKLLSLAFQIFQGVGVAKTFLHVDTRDGIKSTWTY